MHSLINLRKSSLTAVAIAGCLVAFTGSASANSVTLSINGGAASGSLATVSGTSNSFTVTVFANLTAEGGGQNTVVVNLNYDSSLLTATGCQEAGGTYLIGTSPVPHTGQVVGGFLYGPFVTPHIPNCGAGSPGDGGLTTPGVVNLIAQERAIGIDATTGTLRLGTVRFHFAAGGTSNISANFGLGLSGRPLRRR